ncbi:formimidoylglutamase [Reinekea marina]|uniref:Formimidoylglutamase n=1 Tax=Reinekea marina TaxID=1310421 RepID=A0ABV7WND3_9GAMM|nr:formimidoylglutamase [Reinekea marina]MDN3647871.1 formimidoylglutamase [Reinekea marina]
MSTPEAHKNCWQGRVDTEDASTSIRLHQQVILEKQTDYKNALVLVGFESDEGVARNQGRRGAAQGPNALRSALANLVSPKNVQLYDAGNISCEGQSPEQKLEQAQQLYAKEVEAILTAGGQPIGLGGGHEIAWASFLGTQQYLQKHQPNTRLGILNFDAHFDLRNPKPITSSGTPFRQAQQWSNANNQPFQYKVIGLNPSANTQALFDFAQSQNVQWVNDTHCGETDIETIMSNLETWLHTIDALYLTVCLDVFPAGDAPGVSAPAALGVQPLVVLKLISRIKALLKTMKKPLIMADVAELNPGLDVDGKTAKLAARVVYSLISG